MIYYLGTFGAAALGCYALNFPVRKWAAIRGFLDEPGERKLHASAVPYGGGAGIYFALVLTLIFLYYIYPPAFLFQRQFLAIIIGGLFAVLAGLWDDARGSGAVLKLTVEALIAAFMYSQEFRISRLSVPGVMTVELGYWGIPATIFWFWLMMNAINLIDGMDGLAAGVTAIAATTILIIAYDSSRPFDVFFALIVIGLCVGFLPHNFHPARLFMGDAGSLTLGFLLASLSLSTSTKAPALLPILIPFLAVGMPVFDTAHAFFRRIFIGRHPFQADTKHLHHRLLALGLSQNRTVLFLYYISAYLGAMAYVLSKAPAHITALVVALLMVGLFLLAENLSSLDKKRDEKE
ncbi:MAG TPA: MraY family glycosyltransferase [Candidatus Sumerlaeota bacterium]|nr:MAG: putative undecaprenyl-phosphate N-acetylglucosaminyl 1-phosphate transferase [candidate division BRC1 bacterium ADurb.Bin183]HOE63268.1 MraY family glycosyltransferase [Candidatus Sumerlaeota bacterium]HRR29856.1 MraY family glycosyltransferase [Candidatus Sumerlaeia bacterium]HON50626.1 MraY family glycosyltransferase [Candidatus Sumerlaeota bacterium]HOR65448.1 MraY family glycosyltransferase [Candidatus Sumerlaeota bacterium]